jgi:hypothetical protein
MSKALSETERNYKIYDKEMLTLEEWQQYLLGASECFEIWTDHQNLQYFRKPQKLNRHQARWITELTEYEFKLEHKPGKTHVKPDILLRQTDHEREEKDNENPILLKPWHFCQQEFIFESTDDDFVKRILTSRNAKDQIVERMLTNQEKNWKEDEKGMVTWEQRIYVPQNKQLQEDIIREHHNSIMAGHPR